MKSKLGLKREKRNSEIRIINREHRQQEKAKRDIKKSIDRRKGIADRKRLRVFHFFRTNRQIILTSHRKIPFIWLKRLMSYDIIHIVKCLQWMHFLSLLLFIEMATALLSAWILLFQKLNLRKVAVRFLQSRGMDPSVTC